jgi:hypothetical protein
MVMQQVFPKVAVDIYPPVVIGVEFVSTFVDWVDQSLVPNTREDARAEDDVKEFKYIANWNLWSVYLIIYFLILQAFLGWRVCIFSCGSFNVIGESSGFWSSLVVDYKICI